MGQCEKTSTLQSKLCLRCGQLKPKSEFYTDKKNPDGLYHYCRSCHQVFTNSYRMRHKEQYTQWERERYHRIQDEAGCYHKIREFYSGFRLLKALANAPVVEI